MIWLLYAAASAATIWFAAFSLSDRERRKVVAWALLYGCLVCNLAHMHRESIFYPIVDAALGYLFLCLWIDRPEKWLAQLFGAVMLMTLAHVAYQSALLLGIQIGYAYRTVLNGLFLCQLWIVAKDGLPRGMDCIGRIAVHAWRVGRYGFCALARAEGRRGQ